jgi:CRP-like cAMP-binding protein
MQLKRGDSFGEISILENKSRTNSVIAIKDSLLLQLKDADYKIHFEA